MWREATKEEISSVIKHGVWKLLMHQRMSSLSNVDGYLLGRKMQRKGEKIQGKISG